MLYFSERWMNTEFDLLGFVFSICGCCSRTPRVLDLSLLLQAKIQLLAWSGLTDLVFPVRDSALLFILFHSGWYRCDCFSLCIAKPCDESKLLCYCCSSYSCSFTREQFYDSSFLPHSLLCWYRSLTEGRALWEPAFIILVCTNLIYVYRPPLTSPPLFCLDFSVGSSTVTAKYHLKALVKWSHGGRGLIAHSSRISGQWSIKLRNDCGASK